MKNKIIITSLMIFSFLRVIFSQNAVVLRGVVTDSLSKSLPFVNVYSQEGENKPITAFTTTDEAGHFVLKTTRSKAIVLKATLLGYDAKPLIFNENDTIPQLIKVIMYPKTFVLKETVVKGNGKIIEKSDTTTFLADKFRDSTERNLEELLAKLPGVGVDKTTGTISVKGQPIKKILIEGDDLTGHNYQLISKNLSADVIDKIQVIDKFNDNKLLRGIRRSDDKVINITLKNNRKNILFGNAILGIGNDWRINNSLNLFSFNKKIKSLTFGNFNTIGNRSDADMMLNNDFSEDESATIQQQSLVNDDNKQSINIEHIPSVNIGLQSVRFNRATMLSSHFIVRPLERLQLKASVSFANDNLHTFVDNEYRYRLVDSTLNLFEKNEWSHRPEIWKTQLVAGFDLSENTTIRYKTDIKIAQIKDVSRTLVNTNFFNNELVNSSLSWYNALDFTHRLSEQKAVVFNMIYSQQQSEQLYQISQSQNRIFSLIPQDTFRNLLQMIDKPTQLSAINAQFLYSKEQKKIALTIGTVQKIHDFSTNLSLMDSNTIVQSLPLGFQHKAHFTQTNYYTSLNLKNRFRAIDFFSDISGGYYSLKYTDILQKDRLKGGLYVLPVIGFQKQDGKSTIFCTYAFNVALPQMADIFSGYIVSDYRSIQRGSVLFIPANSHTAILNTTYGSFSDNFMCYANLIGTTTQHGYRDDWRINSDFNISEKVENMLLNKNLVLSSGIEYFSKNLSARIKIRPSFSANWYQNTLNGTDLRNNQSISNILDVSIRSGYLGWFNYHLGSTLRLSNIKTEVFSGGVFNTKNISIGSFLDFNLKFSDRWRGSIENEIFQFQQSNTPPQYYSFVNSTLYYEITRSKVYFTLTGRNLLNTSIFVNSTITDLSSQVNRVRLLPRYVLAEINFRF